MARRRFFATALSGERARIEGSGALHLARVLRARSGQEYELAWEGRVYLGRIETVHPQAVEFAVGEALPGAAEPVLEAGVALFNFSRLEWMLEKATELGLSRLWPLLTERSDPRLAAAAHKRRARWQRIARQAAEQSRRAAVPEIAAPLRLADFLALPAPPARWLLAETPGGAALPAQTPCRLLAGPEGGWSAQEGAAARAAGFTAVTLGPRILRSETALLAALVLAGR